MSLYYEDEHVTLYHGDSLEVMKTLDSVDHIITDPPYNISDRNGRDGTTAATLKRKDGTARKLWKDFGEWDRKWDAGPFLAEAKRLIRENGSLIAFTSEHLLAAYLASGMNHRSLIYWRKTNPTPAFRSLYVNAAEIAVWQVNGKSKWVFNAGGYHPNVYEGASIGGSQRFHPNQKPAWLMSKLVEVHSDHGETILDPFSGSGATLLAAKLQGRKAIGVELEERYCEIIAKRVSQGVLDFGTVS